MSDCGCCTTWALVAAVCALFYMIVTWNFGYWKKKGVKEVKSYPILGSFPSVFTQKHHMAFDIDEIYRKYRDDENYVGVFTAGKPQLLVLNPEFAHKIFVNDFKSFHDNEFSNFVDEKKDVIFANNPFTIKGEVWKERRQEITPGLTMNRIKSAYPVTLEVCDRFISYLKKQAKMSGRDGIDTIDLCLRFTCEVTTDCVLGVKANTMADQPGEFLEMTKSIFKADFKMIAYQLLCGIFPDLVKYYKIRFFPEPAQNFFFDVMGEAIRLRKKEKTDRVDFLNFLLQLQEKKNLSTLQMAAHTMTFLIDGFFTTAVTISHCLLLLARNPRKQEQLREEINKNLEADGTMNFEKLHELPYLHACIHETLRLFSPLVFASKLCTETYETENKDGSKLTLKPDDVVIVPVNSIHLDEKYYENPNDFIPERFLEEDSIKNHREKGLFLGFGDGPRVCLGMRFALTQAKACLSQVIHNFNVRANPKTRSDNRLDPIQFVAMLDGGIWLDFEELN